MAGETCAGRMLRTDGLNLFRVGWVVDGKSSIIEQDGVADV